MRVLRFRFSPPIGATSGMSASQLQRGGVRVGAARRNSSGCPCREAAACRGAELVLGKFLMTSLLSATIAETGGPDGRSRRILQDRPWGLKDFRILDPAGYYLRITDRAR